VTNLAGLLEDAASGHAESDALVLDGLASSYGSLREDAVRFAGAFRERGVEAGDRVAIVLPNGPVWVAAYYGALRIGAVVVPLSPLLRDPEIEQRLGDSEPRVLLAPAERSGPLEASLAGLGVLSLQPDDADGAPPVEELVERADADPAVILYTSGTTSGPKGAELSHGAMRWTAHLLAGPLLRLGPEDVVFGAAPFSHIFGQTGCLNASFAAAARLVLMPRFEAASALELIRETGVTVFLGVPTMCIALLEAAERVDEVPTFRVAHTGGAPLPVETLRAFGERFECEVLEGYGLTETAGGVVSHLSGQRCKPGSVGTAVDGAEARIVDADGLDVAAGTAGEVLVRTPGALSRYWRRPTETAAALSSDGWFATGDVGYLDEDGYLFLIDRKKDLILRGGYSVYPREIEEVLYQHPAVVECAVVGVPDARLGEEVVAVVVPREGVPFDAAELRAFVRERVAAYTYPRLVVAVETLPKGPSGKILKREIDRVELRTQLAAASRDVPGA
jgi:long-chain acyl-CoA synthetase